MKDINYFLDDAQNSRQGQFELDFAEVITCFDTNETTVVTENGRTVIITWDVSGFFQSYRVIYETSQMEYTIDREVVLQVIEQLKYIEVDGETMQYILQRVGMQDQMLKQLIMSQPIEEVKDMYYERRELEQSNKR